MGTNEQVFFIGSSSWEVIMKMGLQGRVARNVCSVATIACVMTWSAAVNAVTLAVSPDQSTLTLYSDDLQTVHGTVNSIGTIHDAQFLSDGRVSVIAGNSTLGAHFFNGANLGALGSNGGWSDLGQMTELANGKVAYSYLDGSTYGALIVDGNTGTGQTYSTGSIAGPDQLFGLSNGNLFISDGNGAVRTLDGNTANQLGSNGGWSQIGAIAELNNGKVAFSSTDAGTHYFIVAEADFSSTNSENTNALATKLSVLNHSTGDILAQTNEGVYAFQDNSGTTVTLGTQTGWGTIGTAIERTNGDIAFSGDDVSLANFVRGFEADSGTSTGFNAGWGDVPQELYALSNDSINAVLDNGDGTYRLIRLLPNFTSGGSNTGWDSITDTHLVSSDRIVGIFETGGTFGVRLFDGLTVSSLDSNAGWTDPEFLEAFEGDYVLFADGTHNSGTLFAFDVSGGSLTLLGSVASVGDGAYLVDHYDGVPIPEPASLILVTAGGALVLLRRKDQA